MWKDKLSDLIAAIEALPEYTAVTAELATQEQKVKEGDAARKAVNVLENIKKGIQITRTKIRD